MTFRACTLWLFGLTSSLALGAGCGDGGGNDARIAVNWDVAYVGGQAAGCDRAGTPWVRLEARSAGSQHLYSFDFDCAPLNGLTDYLPPGSYDITLSLLDAKKRPVASTSGNFAIRRRGVNELDPVQFQVQALQVSWLMVLQEMGGAMKTPSCEALGVSKIEFSAQLSGDEVGETFQFACILNPGQGLTTAVRTGNYAYQFQLLDAADKPITQSDIKSVVVGPGPQLTAVPPERFAFQ